MAGGRKNRDETAKCFCQLASRMVQIVRLRTTLPSRTDVHAKSNSYATYKRMHHPTNLLQDGLALEIALHVSSPWSANCYRRRAPISASTKRDQNVSEPEDRNLSCAFEKDGPNWNLCFASTSVFRVALQKHWSSLVAFAHCMTWLVNR